MKPLLNCIGPTFRLQIWSGTIRGVIARWDVFHLDAIIFESVHLRQQKKVKE
jgi:hypothetical protein